MKSRIQLLVIDPQNDFCDVPETYRPVDPLAADGARIAPALPVAGAHLDMQRVASLIRTAGDALSGIAITLDSHHRVDIAHPTFWRQGDGAAVGPFTAITAAEVRAGRYRPREASALPRTLAYLDELEARGRYTLMVWPVHCEIGSWGHGVHADLRAAYNGWEERHLQGVLKVTKGDNPWTEHYSAVQAEVPDPDDEATQVNLALLDWLAPAELILVAGEASSHCVRSTTEHLVEHLRDGAARLVLLTDCMSPVAGFEAQHDAFLAAMRTAGARLATSDALIAELTRTAAIA